MHVISLIIISRDQRIVAVLTQVHAKQNYRPYSPSIEEDLEKEHAALETISLGQIRKRILLPPLIHTLNENRYAPQAQRFKVHVEHVLEQPIWSSFFRAEIRNPSVLPLLCLHLYQVFRSRCAQPLTSKKSLNSTTNTLRGIANLGLGQWLSVHRHLTSITEYSAKTRGAYLPTNVMWMVSRNHVVTCTWQDSPDISAANISSEGHFSS